MCWIHLFPSRSSFFIIHNHGNLQVFKQAENTIWPTEQHLMFVLSSLHGDHPFANSQRAVALWRRLPCARWDERRGLCSCALCGTPARGPYPSMCWLALVANVCRQLGPSVGEGQSVRRVLAPSVQRRARRWGIIHPSLTGGGGWPATYKTVKLVEVGGSDVRTETGGDSLGRFRCAQAQRVLVFFFSLGLGLCTVGNVTLQPGLRLTRIWRRHFCEDKRYQNLIYVWLKSVRLLILFFILYKQWKFLAIKMWI
jgi:hypothetical protein